MKTTKTWFITGCSSGFGYAMAQTALAQGDRVIATARQIDALLPWQTQFPGQARVYALDVTQPDHVMVVAKQAAQDAGQIDVVVNNAGYGLVGAIEEVSDIEFRAIFDTDVFGLLNVTRALLPILRQQRSGHIINFSSVAGIRGSAGLGAYNAAKFAVEGLSEALAEELRPLGIHVTIVEPGGFRTNWGGKSMRFSEQTITDYANSQKGIRGFFQSGQMPKRAGGDPQKLAAVVIKLAHLPQPPLRLALGADAYSVVEAKASSLLTNLHAHQELTYEAAG